MGNNISVSTLKLRVIPKGVGRQHAMMRDCDDATEDAPMTGQVRGGKSSKMKFH